MRNLSILLAMLWCHAAVVSAEPVGSPASLLKKGKWALGLTGGAVVDRGMEGPGGHRGGWQRSRFRECK